jgi:KaiC/GvpD/RAD55 family RecA-like ATPase
MRGKGLRCTGFASGDGDFFHCSREQQAGPIPMTQGSQTFAHRAKGACPCGATHRDDPNAWRFPVGPGDFRDIDCTYDYRDEHGKLLFQVVRLIPKDFRQRQPKPGGGWQNNLQGVRRVLYRLPELLAKPLEPVYINEGEKDVDNMHERGLLATCNPMGASKSDGKWKAVDACARAALKDRDVCIIVDADDDGRAHAKHIAENVVAYARTVRLLELPNAKDVSDWFAAGGTAEQLETMRVQSPVYRTRDGDDAAADRDDEPTKEGNDEPQPRTTERKHFRCRDLVDEILKEAKEPSLPISLGDEQLMLVRPGGIVLLIGGTGRGKTSLAATIAIEHAWSRGPTLTWSLELPPHEWTARAIGIKCDASWMATLTGQLAREHMIAALPDRLAIMAHRSRASVNDVREVIRELKREFPGEPVLLVADYVQLMKSDEKEIRRRVADAMEKLDAIARDERVVVLALSQGSRASARELSSGEKLGAETTDTGAEAAELERWSTYTIAIGKLGERAEDGTRPADLSLGKARMSEDGDTVRPARFCGRSGRWRIVGESKSADEVRKAREKEQRERDVNAAKLAMLGGAQKAREPLTAEELMKMANCVGRKRPTGKAALDALLHSGELAEVRKKKSPKAKAWRIWTPEHARKAGIPLVSETSGPAADEDAAA